MLWGYDNGIRAITLARTSMRFDRQRNHVIIPSGVNVECSFPAQLIRYCRVSVMMLYLPRRVPSVKAETVCTGFSGFAAVAQLVVQRIRK